MATVSESSNGNNVIVNTTNTQVKIVSPPDNKLVTPQLTQNRVIISDPSSADAINTRVTEVRSVSIIDVERTVTVNNTRINR